jgi:hypothetical protein
VPEPGTIARDLTCAECGRAPRAGETWRVVFVDIAEAATYCPECAEREFGEADYLPQSRSVMELLKGLGERMLALIIAGSEVASEPEILSRAAGDREVGALAARTGPRG